MDLNSLNLVKETPQTCIGERCRYTKEYPIKMKQVKIIQFIGKGNFNENILRITYLY